MLQRDDTQASIERVSPERHGRNICDGIQPAVVPGDIAHRQVNAAITVPPEKVRVLALARARIQNPRTVGRLAREALHGVFDGALKMQDVSP